MVTGQRQAGDNGGRRCGRRDLADGELVADDAVVDLGIQTVVVERNAGAAVAAGRWSLAEALNDVGVAVSMRVLERDQEAAGRRVSF
jgi:hypothetical protein